MILRIFAYTIDEFGLPDIDWENSIFDYEWLKTIYHLLFRSVEQ